MRPAAGAVIEVAGEIGKRRVVRGQPANARIQRGGHDRQRSALTASCDDEVHSVPLGMAGQKVVGADTAEIDTAIVVTLPAFEPDRVVVRQCAGAERVVYRLIQNHGYTVNPDLQS